MTTYCYTHGIMYGGCVTCSPSGFPMHVSKNMPANTAVLINIDGRREIVTDNANLFWVRMYAQAARLEARAHLRRIVADTEARLFGVAA